MACLEYNQKFHVGQSHLRSDDQTEDLSTRTTLRSHFSENLGGNCVVLVAHMDTLQGYSQGGFLYGVGG